MSSSPDSRLHHAFLLGSKKEFRRLLALPAAASSGGAFGGGGGGGAAGLSSSGARSWQNHSLLSHFAGGSSSSSQERIDVNARDTLGRTVLHLLASSADPAALDFLRLLLDSQPKSGLAVNAQDVESGWTALHRALYVGNLAAARVLLADDGVDPRVKDWEDLTCWDLFNGTVEGTNPPEDATAGDALFTWGTNRNFTLGTDGDRALPERIQLKRAERKPAPASTAAAAADDSDDDDDSSDGSDDGDDVLGVEDDVGAGAQRHDLRLFEPVGVKQVVMSKLHTGVITAERSNNVSLCGFGSGGRLGRSVHTQIELAPIPDFPQQVTSLALGQDHTLALTASGHVLSWGLNRFGTLGYAVDAPSLGSKFTKDPEEAFQSSPRRILGPLKKEVVRGVAASRCSSACWTDDAVWTWGHNNGHLGYDVGPGAVQVPPRKVAGITQAVVGLALTDFALCCLLATNDVVCFYRGGSTKVTFPAAHNFFAESAIYRPPQFNKRLKVTKVTASGITFACLTSLGDVFTFALPSPTEVEREAASAGVSLKDRAGLIKPQRTWALRKRFTAVKDVALGSDGSIILCTQSGHVYVRSRTKALGANGGGSHPAGWPSSSSKQFKFHRMPYLQRVIRVAANETGAFGAIRVDAVSRPVVLEGATVGEDLTMLQPHVQRFMDGRKGSYLLGPADQPERATPAAAAADDDGEVEVAAIRADVKVATQLVEITETWAALTGRYRALVGCRPGESDCVVVAGGRETPAHAFVLAARCPALFVPSDHVAVDRTADGVVRVTLLGPCEHLTVLLFLHYLYADDLLAVWDSRIGARLHERHALAAGQIDLQRVRTELQRLGQALDLPRLTPVLDRLTKTPVAPSLAADLARAFAAAQAPALAPDSPLRADLVVRLADRRVEAHACVLRSRSPFFAALYDDADWTRLRVDDGGVVEVDMAHLPWPVMRLVFRYLYEGAGPELFEYHHQPTLDLFLNFVFDVLAAATELLLDPLVLVCSAVVLRHVTIHNVCSLLDTATFFNALALRDALQHYVSQNMETMLESHYLDAMPADLLADLSAFVVGQQAERLPISRSNILVAALMEDHKAWLALQDIPKPSIRPAGQAGRPFQPRSPRMSPVELTPPPSAAKPQRRMTRTTIVSPAGSPALRPSAGPDDDLFTMDEDDDVAGLAAGIAASLALGAPAASASSSAGPSTTLSTPAKPIWKPRTVEASKTDLRSIMSEAASTTRPAPATSPHPRPSIDPTPSLSFKLSQRDRKKIQSQPVAVPTPVRPAGDGAAGSSASPWRAVAPVAAAPLAPSLPSSQTSTPFSSSPRRGSAFPTVGAMSRSGSSTGPGTAAAQTRPLAANASGEVIRPVRATPSFTPRKVSSDPAWITPTFASPPPVARPSLTPPPATSSFAHIQAQQHLDRAAVAAGPSKTLAQIQREEEADRRAAVEEAEFMRWWAEEEKRIKAEEAAAASVFGLAPAAPAQNAGGSASKKSGGKGGGRPKKPPAAATASGSGATPASGGGAKPGGGRGKGGSSSANAAGSSQEPRRSSTGGQRGAPRGAPEAGNGGGSNGAPSSRSGGRGPKGGNAPPPSSSSATPAPARPPLPPKPSAPPAAASLNVNAGMFVPGG